MTSQSSASLDPLDFDADEPQTGVRPRELPVESGVHAVTRDANRPRSMAGVVGHSQALVELYRLVDRVAPAQCTVLVTGESGTGKELVARAVHDASARAGKPFVAINCGAIPEALIESELFGHARGAFTGAHAARAGRIAAAEGGTIFLDEVGELPLAVQVKLLRFLQTYEYSPVGDTHVRKANVRVVAATNVDLEEAVEAGRFREDLFYRLNVVHLMVPSLRERPEDIAELSRHFVSLACSRLGRAPMDISAPAMTALVAWSWPGNVRELENVIERAVVLCAGDAVALEDLPPRVRGDGPATASAASSPFPEEGVDLRQAVEFFENDLIKRALERSAWNKNQAARLLGINRTTLVEMIKRKRLARPAA